MGACNTKKSEVTEYVVLIKGLFNAGKSTMLQKLQIGEVQTTKPVLDYDVEYVTIKNFRYTVWDCGGRCSLRPWYRHYYRNTKAVVFVVNSACKESFLMTKYELQLTLKEEELQDAVFLILANKQDLPEAVSVEEIARELDLYKMKQRGTIFGTSGKTGEGMFEAFDWLSATLNDIKFKKERENLEEPAKGDLVTKAMDYLTKKVKSAKLFC